MSPDNLADFRRVMAEAEALESALEALESPGQAVAASEALKALPRGDVANLMELTTRRAIDRMTGRPLDPVTEIPLGWDGQDWEAHCLRTCLEAWNAWAEGEVDETASLLESLRRQQAEREAADGRPGAIHLLALYLWVGAIDHLAHGNSQEALRLWHRATEISSQYGTESAPLIRWTLAASFFPAPSRYTPALMDHP